MVMELTSCPMVHSPVNIKPWNHQLYRVIKFGELKYHPGELLLTYYIDHATQRAISGPGADM